MLVIVDSSDSLTRQVMHTARLLRKARREALAPYGLAPHQAGAFLAIARHTRHHPEAELRLSGLARYLRIAPRSATEVVDALCHRGLIQRRPSPTDRRATSLILTQAGEDLLDDVRQANPADDVFSPLTDSEQRTLAQLLAKVLTHQEEA